LTNVSIPDAEIELARLVSEAEVEDSVENATKVLAQKNHVAQASV
jgi:hypothetical protein